MDAESRACPRCRLTASRAIDAAAAAAERPNNEDDGTNQRALDNAAELSNVTHNCMEKLDDGLIEMSNFAPMFFRKRK